MKTGDKRVPPSVGEIAFRIAACTGIALFLYAIPDLRADRERQIAPSQMDEIAEGPVSASSEATTCLPSERGVRLVDVALERR
ncbi:hypothetical protein [Aureimonas sp. ME7]|uniref:hypothetical protein n=1 Tax=Aureimonas sp. ME7 TaxID=2744252 RepID=UPI0015F5FF49|nr:hypothetical protein [Aureimonas sp. ME7]